MVSGPLLGARAGRTVVLRLLADSNLKNFRWHGNRLGNEIGGHLSRRQELSGRRPRTEKSCIAEGKVRYRGRESRVSQVVKSRINFRKSELNSTKVPYPISKVRYRGGLTMELRRGLGEIAEGFRRK